MCVDRTLSNNKGIKQIKFKSLLFKQEKVNTSENADNLLLKQTVMMSYGYVTLYAPVSLVTSRVDAVIVRNITPHFSNQKVRIHVFTGYFEGDNLLFCLFNFLDM